MFRLAGLGLELGGAVVGGCLIGWYVDRRFETRYGLVTGALIGIVGGMYNLLRQSMQVIREEQKRMDDGSNDDVSGDA